MSQTLPTTEAVLNYLAPTNSSLVVESSVNLLSWIPIVTNIIQSNPTYFSDPVSTSLSKRFYRLRLLP